MKASSKCFFDINVRKDDYLMELNERFGKYDMKNFKLNKNTLVKSSLINSDKGIKKKNVSNKNKYDNNRKMNDNKPFLNISNLTILNSIKTPINSNKIANPVPINKKINSLYDELNNIRKSVSFVSINNTQINVENEAKKRTIKSSIQTETIQKLKIIMKCI